MVMTLGFNDDQPKSWEAAQADAAEMMQYGENEVELEPFGTKLSAKAQRASYRVTQPEVLELQ
jgi:hypothetical protein